MDKPWQDNYVNVDGVKTHYLEAGMGDTLLLIHGGGVESCAEINYGEVIGPLSKYFHVIAADTIGFGLTPGRGPQDYTFESQGNFLINFLDTIWSFQHIT